MKKTLRSYAKINLFLKILGKRKDGFHELETLMQEIDLCDEIIIEDSEQTELVCTHQDVPTDESNLILQALKLFNLHFAQDRRYKIKLIKNIPIGGGLGGGSSNGMALLEHLVREQVSAPEERISHLMKLAAQLGSDTSFFTYGFSALCRGRGEIVEPLRSRHFFYNLMIPPFACATPKVFSHWEEDETPPTHTSQFVDSWVKKSPLVPENDLTKACTLAYPDISKIIKILHRQKVKVYLSGSGSTLFTLHETQEAASEVQQLLETTLDGSGVLVLPTKSRENKGFSDEKLIKI